MFVSFVLGTKNISKLPLSSDWTQFPGEEIKPANLSTSCKVGTAETSLATRLLSRLET
jgi:hypothetical protein